MSDVYTLHRGTHAAAGQHAARRHASCRADLRARYVERALGSRRHRLASRPRCTTSSRELGASLLVPRYSRYLIDLNRPPENTPMYPGVNNTELCPTRFFTGDAAVPRRRGARRQPRSPRRVEPTGSPTTTRCDAELARLQAAHGHAVLFDAHSIKSRAAVAVRRQAAAT